MSDTDKLMSAYLDDDISPDQLRDLEEWLEESPDHVREFVKATHLHRTLRDMTFGQNAHAVLSPLATDSDAGRKSGCGGFDSRSHGED